MKYILDNRKSKKGYAVKLHAEEHGQRVLLNTGIYAENMTDFVNEEFTRSDRNYMYKNNRLNSIKADVKRLIILKVTDLNARCKAIIKGGEVQDYIPKPKVRTFVSVLDEFVSRKERQGTITCYMQTRKKVVAFDAGVTFEQMDTDWLYRFDAMLAKTMSVNGKAIVLRNIRAIWNYALDMDITNAKYPFKRTSSATSARFGIKHEQTRKRNVPIELLRQLKDYPVEPYQKPYRDLFLLMVYLVGIDIVDIVHLKKSDLRDGYLYYVRRKTDKENANERRMLKIKVEPEAMELIRELEGENWLLYPMDTYTDHHDYLRRMNNALRTIGMVHKTGCRTTGKPLIEGLTSKWSRHTWATLAADLDYSEDLIGRALGHSQSSSRSVTKTYINFGQRKIDEANRKVIDYILQDEQEGCKFVSLFG